MRAHRGGAPLDRGAGRHVRDGDAGEGARGESGLMDWLATRSTVWFGSLWGPAFYETVTSVAFIVSIVVTLMLTVAYLTLWERKLIGWIQIRIGPNRVGPRGLLQPFADVLKLLMKEIIVPANADRFLFVIAPILTLAPSLVAWAVIPFTGTLWLTDVDAGLLFLLALTSMGVYGVIIIGWASNSKYAFL